MTRIRLVVASPSDVEPERDAVEDVARELNRLVGRTSDFFIDVYRWETDSGPGFHVKGSQGNIDQDLGVEECDVMVAIFWTRFGTPILGDTEVGTEHEINLAHDAWKKNGHKPQILVFFKTAAPDWDRIDGTQIARVKDFKHRFEVGGTYETGQYDTFVDIEELKQKLRQNLYRRLPIRSGRDLNEPPRVAAPSCAFDYDGYRLRFGFQQKWDLAKIGVAQPPGDAPVSPSLDQIYQELRIAERSEPNEQEPGTPILAEQVAVLEDRLMLVGGAGAGKTTWIRHTFSQLLGRSEVCPFLIELRKLAAVLQNRTNTGRERSLVSYVQRILEEMDCAALGLEKALSDQAVPRPILLVDGWDELGELGQEFRQKLASFLRAHPRVGVVATSRPYGQDKPDAADGFVHKYLQPLNNGEIASFSSRFWRVCYGKDPRHEEYAQRFQEALKSSRSAIELARSPLLCTMMLFISRSQTLPDERHNLYQTCLAHMLTAYRREEAYVLGMPHHWRPEKLNERLRAVAALAFAAHETQQHLGSRAILMSARQMADLLPQSLAEHKHGFIAWLAGPAGILTEYDDGSLSFVHLSFQEYLAAWHIAYVLRAEGQRFGKWCRDEKWGEVLRLWAGIVWEGPRERFAVVADRLLNTDDGLCALGGMLADGWGAADLFSRWVRRLVLLLQHRQVAGLRQCAVAWARCRQTERRLELQRALNEEAPSWNWWARVRTEVWCREANLKLPPARGQVKVIFEARNARMSTEEHCALGRVWTFAEPTWPGDPWEVALCQAWPSARRLLGMRVQNFFTLAGEAEWTEAVASLLIGFGEKDARRRFVEFSHDIVEQLNMFPLEDRRFVPHQQAKLELGWELARYEAQFGVHLKPGRTHRHAVLKWNVQALRQNRSAKIFSVARFGDWYLSWVMASGRLSQPFVRLLVQAYSRLVIEDSSEPRRNVTKVPGLPLADFLAVESAANSRGAARATLSALKAPKNATVALISAACRECMQPGRHVEELDGALRSYRGDPLWGALARHIARRSTVEDRKLLVDCASHPERRDPPLQWGLRYIVRGDIMMADGSTRRLDSFFEGDRFGQLAYLEAVPTAEDIAAMCQLRTP